MGATAMEQQQEREGESGEERERESERGETVRSSVKENRGQF